MTRCEARSSTSLGEWRTRRVHVVRTPDGGEDPLSALDEVSSRQLGVVIKGETAHRFQNRSTILPAAMRRGRTPE
jgi:hypothetical protein